MLWAHYKPICKNMVTNYKWLLDYFEQLQKPYEEVPDHSSLQRQ